MYMQAIHRAPPDATADPSGVDDEPTRRPLPRRLSDDAAPRASTPAPRADEWDEWKSVRDLA